jgi:D-sedoheptulose 7-phosphate isomerase
MASNSGSDPATGTYDFAEKYRNKLQSALDAIDISAVAEAAALLQDARVRNASIFVCGNGGSASTASHFATDVIKSASYGRDIRFRILALTDSVSTITAYGNDVSYDSVFTEQLRNFAKPGDVFMAISGSGNSPNVVGAMTYANEAGCKTIALTGRGGGQLGPLAQVEVRAADTHMGRIEDVHMVVCHMLCYYFIDGE